ncbi:MAG: hypothetical protein LBT05_08825 [Planctomycetaceae bacterium]|jgi:hypothetical protein|nr:hypothetical protein [Planctomycetaceae bacterium]
MTNKRFRTKIIHLLIIFVFLVPLFLLGKPAAVQRGDEGQSRLSGGYLASLRIDEDIVDAQLGEIDPGSSTIKFATFGMRGVALALLWHKSLEYEKYHDWNNVIVTSNQITLLEPRFISVWEYLGWRLAYNASADQDDYRERYRWVIRGFEFLEQGIVYNRKAPILYHNAGWTISQKIGIADEKEQYRTLFRQDDEFHNDPARIHKAQSIAERDNWLYGIPLYKISEDLFRKVEDSYFKAKESGSLSEDDIAAHYQDRKRSIGNKARPIFYVNSTMNLIHYADWYELDGNFGEKAAANWADAQRAWENFSRIEMKTTIDDRRDKTQKRSMKLADAEEAQKKMNEHRDELLKLLAPKTLKDLYAERWKALTDLQQGALVDMVKSSDLEQYVAIREYLNENEPGWEENLTKLRNSLITAPDELAAYLLPASIRVANEMPPEETSEENKNGEVSETNLADKAARNLSEVVSQAGGTLTISNDAIAVEIGKQEREAGETGSKKAALAREICRAIEDQEYKRQFSHMFCELLNYEHYKNETYVEQTQEAIDAREERFYARKAFNEDGDVFTANRRYLESMRKWNLLMELPQYAFLKTETFRRDFIDFADKYKLILNKLDERGGLYPEDFPFEHLVRLEMETTTSIPDMHRALDFVRNVYEKRDYAEAIKRSSLLLRAWNNTMAGNEYLKQVPVPQYRDEILETAAIYINSLRQSGQEFDRAFPLTGFIDTVMFYDSLTEDAIKKTENVNQMAVNTTPVGTPTESQTLESVFNALTETCAAWDKAYQKYPILYLPQESLFDPTSQFNAMHLISCQQNALLIASSYLQLLQQLKRPVPQDFPLRELLPPGVTFASPATETPTPQPPQEAKPAEPEIKPAEEKPSEPIPPSATEEAKPDEIKPADTPPPENQPQ